MNYSKFPNKLNESEKKSSVAVFFFISFSTKEYLQSTHCNIHAVSKLEYIIKCVRFIIWLYIV